MQRVPAEKNQSQETALHKQKSFASNLRLQRCDDNEIEHANASTARNTLSSSGKPLEPATRAFMESKLAYNFGNVHIHTDEKAAASARSLNALAYTVSHDVAFGAGQYAPLSEKGLNLLAHELSHVAQQEQDGVPRIQRAKANSQATAAPVTVKAYQFSADGKTFILTEEQYNLEKARVLRNLAGNFQRVEEEAKFNRQMHQEFLDKTHNWVGVISDILGDTVPPSVGIWTWSNAAIVNGRKALEEGKPELAGRQLKLAQESLRDAQREYNTYMDKTTGGAGKAVTALEYTRDISFSIAIGTAAVIAAPVVAGALAGGATIVTGSAIASGVIVTAGGGATGAALRGGSSIAGQALAGGVNKGEVWRETKEGFKRGVVDAGSAVVGFGAGKALGVGAKGAKLGKEMLKTGAAGTASGATGGALEATFEGKSPTEVLEATGKGAISGGLGGTVGGTAAHLAKGKSSLARFAVETLGEAGSGAASAIAAGGSKEDIKKAVISSVVAGRATALAKKPEAPSTKTQETETTQAAGTSAKEPTNAPEQTTKQKIGYGEVELPPGEGDLELDLTGNREGWNKHIDEFQTRDAAKVGAETKKSASAESSSTKIDLEIDEAVEAAFTEGRVTSGEPLELLGHGSAKKARRAKGVSGKQVQSAHGAPQSAMRGLPSYDPKAALTRLLPRDIHRSMDSHWKSEALRLAKQGRTSWTAQEMFDTVSESIRRTNGLSSGEKLSHIQRLSDEIFMESNLKPSDLVRLPFT